MAGLSFGAAMQLSLEKDELPRFLNHIFIENSVAVAGVEMVSYRLMSAETARFSRERKIGSGRLADLIRECCQSSISSITLYSRRSPEGDEVMVVLDTQPSRRSGGRCMFDIIGPLQMCDQGALFNTCEHITERFHVAYGAIMAGEFNYISSVMSWIPIGSVNDLYEEFAKGRIDSPKKRLEDEVLFYQNLQDKFDEHVPRAAWAMILSSAHAEGLSGEERIRRESGCYLVERWGHNLYLQLTEKLSDITTQDLYRFNEYLTPIRFPDSPEAVFLLSV